MPTTLANYRNNLKLVWRLADRCSCLLVVEKPMAAQLPNYNTKATKQAKFTGSKYFNRKSLQGIKSARKVEKIPRFGAWTPHFLLSLLATYSSCCYLAA